MNSTLAIIIAIEFVASLSSRLNRTYTTGYFAFFHAVGSLREAYVAGIPRCLGGKLNMATFVQLFLIRGTA